jgi:WD40 repeat protein
VHSSTGKYSRGPASEPRFVRFSTDGSLIAAYVDHVLHVLRTRDLTELKRIELKGPSSTSRDFKHKGVVRTIVYAPIVKAFELSPRADVAALLWVRDMLYGRVELYDLSSGKQVGAWDAPQGWLEFDRDRGMAWHPNGDLLLLAVPNEMPCSSPGNTPDVFAFGIPSGGIKAQLKTGLLVGDIAVTQDNRVLAVDSDCMTVFKDHDPKLKIFDLNTGKHLHNLHGRGTGVRYTLSVARSVDRVLAYTGKIKIKFDWLDFVALDKTVDATFSVWNLKDYSGVVSSQDLNGLTLPGLRISPNGRFAVSCGKASSVYELP